MYPERVVTRVLSKWTPEGECWISTYSLGSHGYAQVGWKEDGRNLATTAHRVAWWGANRQPIAQGMTVDHICHVKRCVNPLHLRLLTNAENASDNGQVRLGSPTGRSCHLGHPMWRRPSGVTYCPTCKARYMRERRRRVF